LAAAETATVLSQINSAAKGADFVTNGRQLLMVGDNPSGRERVQVTPMDAGGRTTNSNHNATFNITINGNATRDTIDYAYERLEEFSRMYKRASYEGMIR
jgi:hypothetical protein